MENASRVGRWSREATRGFSLRMHSYDARRIQSVLPVQRLGERQLTNCQAEQPDASAWRLILLAAVR